MKTILLISLMFSLMLLVGCVGQTPSPVPPEEKPSQNCTGISPGQCSLNQPQYCDNGVLVDKCSKCGCPAGEACDQATEACIIPVQFCANGVAYNECSKEKPLYCQNGTLVNNCTVCGCPTGMLCNSSNSNCYYASANRSNITNTCPDSRTLYGNCSLEKPLYCNNGTLVNNCTACGCYLRQSCNQTSNTCYTPINPTCTDGTIYSQCSASPPKYCNNGTLVNNCTECGCPANYRCNASSSSCYLPQMFAPTDFATITGCSPFVGSNNAPLKILFVNINMTTSSFDKNVSYLIAAGFENISPYKDNFNSIAFYKIDASSEAINCTSLVGCNIQQVYTAINKTCHVSDLTRVVPVALVNGDAGNYAAPITVLSTLTVGTLMHEVGGHAVGGLGDTYLAWVNPNGVAGGSVDNRRFPNVDGPGCPKWCQSYKPVSEYSNSVGAQCIKIANKNQCISVGTYNITKQNGTVMQICNLTYNSSLRAWNPSCCVWSDTPFEYFNSSCAPLWGVENIGINCLEDSGCYFGAAGNYGWRAGLRSNDSFMSAGGGANRYNAVEMRHLNNVFKCCITDPANPDCTNFRENYSKFLETWIGIKPGSCGYWS